MGYELKMEKNKPVFVIETNKIVACMAVMNGRKETII